MGVSGEDFWTASIDGSAGIGEELGGVIAKWEGTGGVDGGVDEGRLLPGEWKDLIGRELERGTASKSFVVLSVDVAMLVDKSSPLLSCFALSV